VTTTGRGEHDTETRFSSREHWLLVDQADPRRPIVGCHCGFRADVEDDGGYGDSVVDHFAAAVRAEHGEQILAAAQIEHRGPGWSNARHLRHAAMRMDRGQHWGGGNTQRAVARILRAVADMDEAARLAREAQS
jgi:hypothetical protein